MSKLPTISGKKLLKIFKKAGFIEMRRKGSHVFITNASGQLGTVIPIHSNEDLGKGLLKSILSDLELDSDDLMRMLR